MSVETVSKKNKLIKDALGQLAILKMTLDKVEFVDVYSYEQKAISRRIVEIRDILIEAMNHDELGPRGVKS